MTKIKLHGLVAKKFKPVYEMGNISKPLDAILAIDANHDGFKNFFLNEAENNSFYQFIVDGEEIKNAQQVLAKREMQTIDIVPYISGSGPAAIAFTVTLAIGLVMAGIQYLMTPIPENEPKTAVAQLGGNSFWFASKANFTNQFVSAPIGYGELRVGSRVVETTIEATSRNELIKSTAPTAQPGISAGAGAGDITVYSSDGGGDDGGTFGGGSSGGNGIGGARAGGARGGRSAGNVVL